jgi:hypothetical protein
MAKVLGVGSIWILKKYLELLSGSSCEHHLLTKRADTTPADMAARVPLMAWMCGLGPTECMVETYQ